MSSDTRTVWREGWVAETESSRRHFSLKLREDHWYNTAVINYMSESTFDTLKQKLLARLASGDIDDAEYERLLTRMQQETSTGSSARDTQPSHGPRDGSIGDWATGDLTSQRLDVGAELGKFTLLERLGRGGMGEIWKARDSVGDRDVVIKVLPPELSGSPQELARVKDSFRKMHDLNHEYICPTYDLGNDPQIGYFLVMQYLKARTLVAYRQAVVNAFGEFSFKAVMSVLDKLAAALDYSHEHKVIHRDIKPENIMVSPTGKELWLIDFGLAAEIHSSMQRVSNLQMDRSGTYPYMAPEQWKGQLQDARTDQYALAVVAYELLADRLPFEAPDTHVLRQCVLNEPPAPIQDQNDRVNSVLAKALAKEREQRFDSCSKFVAALSDVSQAKSLTRPTSVKKTKAKPSRQESPVRKPTKQRPKRSERPDTKTKSRERPIDSSQSTQEIPLGKSVLVTCPDCNQKVSSHATNCSKCGRPISQSAGQLIKNEERHGIGKATLFFLGLGVLFCFQNNPEWWMIPLGVICFLIGLVCLYQYGASLGDT